jgi:hypothetical protein
MSTILKLEFIAKKLHNIIPISLREVFQETILLNGNK